ncbi:MAG: AAA family ATPase [Anaerolineae bacterium]|jgi:hypothetical protein
MPHEVVSALGENATLFLSGPPGAGKTTLAVQRLQHLLQSEVPAEQILVLVPQRTLATPYYHAIQSAQLPPGATVDVATVGGLARRTLDLFWPLVAAPAGFLHPHRQPRFLTLETAQYYMDRIVEPAIAAGAFDGVAISRSRLVSQIIDNLNKAAAVGFSLDQIAPRLKEAWSGESSMLRILDQTQAVATEFRRICLEESLLDWSLQIETFQRYLLPLPELRRYLLSGYRHLIVDNMEEDIPATHQLLAMWLPLCESALLVYDTDGGYRVFLGADPAGALSLGERCDRHYVLTESHVTSPEVSALGAALAASFDKEIPAPKIDPRPALVFPDPSIRFHPEMLDWVADNVSRLIQTEDVPPAEIAILAPFVSDALRFSLSEKLDRFGVRVRTHRPSRQLREREAARCLLTLAKLAHPEWHCPPPAADVAHALFLSIADMDPVRAHLLTDVVYRTHNDRPELTPFYQIVPRMQERITFLLGGRYSELWEWLRSYIAQAEASDETEHLDHFFSRLFGELLSQPGFGFHLDLDAGRTAANLIESIQKFRRSYFPLPRLGQDYPLDAEPLAALVPAETPTATSLPAEPHQLPASDNGPAAPEDLNLQYLDLVERGVVAAQYLLNWQNQSEDAVLLVPAYTFLMMNHPVQIQFWLDAGNLAWYERIYQPLTHPYVLRRDWKGERWTDEDEVRVRNESMARLLRGLARRCRQRIYLAYSQLNERGFEQQGPLLQAVQRVLREQDRAR